jgi:hypothetical protein
MRGRYPVPMVTGSAPIPGHNAFLSRYGGRLMTKKAPYNDVLVVEDEKEHGAIPEKFGASIRHAGRLTGPLRSRAEIA